MEESELHILLAVLYIVLKYGTRLYSSYSAISRGIHHDKFPRLGANTEEIEGSSPPLAHNSGQVVDKRYGSYRFLACIEQILSAENVI
jgi:hypothetical protein